MISLSLGARIDAKRRSRGKPGGANDTGGGRAPSLIAPPDLEGSGRIGETLSLLPGRWEGLPVPVLSVRWQRDGRDIPGATGFAYVPVPQDDGAEIVARVIAGNTVGTTSATSPARQVIWPAPEARAPIADQFLNPDSGEHVLNVSSNFEGGALRFSVAGEGVSIDPETGVLSIATDALRDGISVTVTAVNSGGAVAQTFRLDVALPEIALPVAPEMVVAPVLPEVAAIGSKISVEAGTWSGTPVPELTYQWLLDGVEIAGAVEVSYLPLPSEDGNLLACRVTASNSAGTAQAVSSAAEVRHATPLAAGGLADLLLDAGSGPVTVAAGAEFSGENLVFSVTGAGAEIDSTTGLVTISTDDLRTEEAITVTAGNSGGSATSSFRVTVRPVAPVLRVAPSLDGTGVIGAPVAVAPGLWDGAPEPALSFRWICGGAVVAGATEATYVPGLAEDGKDLVCEVTATNEGGSETAKTPALALVLPAPVVAGSLADVSAEQGTPAFELDAAAAFSGDGLVFAVAGDGAEIDAGTGLLTITTDMVSDAVEMVVTASNSGGSAEIRFRVSITEKAFVPVPPLMLVGPVLVGSAKVGTAMTVETGSWGGDPAPGIACQWLRDGAPIEGAVGTEYVATAEDDLAGIACRVTATNSGGSAEALTAALTVTHVAPVAKGELFEEILDEGTGPQDIPTAQDFEGQNLAFDVAGAGATIDTATGVVSISTDTPVDGATVTVTATNSGGAAESSFLVTVEAAEPEEPVGPPPPLADDQWQILRSEPSPEIAADSFRPVIAIDAAIPVEAAQWTTSGQKPALPEHWETLAPAGGPNIFTTEMRNKDAGDWHVFAEPQGRRADFRIRYRLVADGAWSEESPVKQVPVPAAVEPEEPEDQSWARFFTSSEAAKLSYDGGKGPNSYFYGKSGFQLQFCHGLVRSPANPNKAMALMDVALGWVTENAEDDWPVWRHTASVGVGNRYSISALFDPDAEDRLLYAISNQSKGNGGGGLYLTDDLGASYRKVLGISNIPGGSGNSYGGFYRNAREVITFDPNNHEHWFFYNATEGVYRSTDRCENWTKVSSDPATKNMGKAGYCFQVSRKNANLIWVGTETGLWKSTNGGTGFTPASSNGLPAGPVTGFDFNPADHDDFYAVVWMQGLFRTTNGGASFSRVATPHNAIGNVYTSPADRSYIWLMGVKNDLNNNSTGKRSLCTTNAGASWSNVIDHPDTYGWDVANFLREIVAVGKDTLDYQFALSPSPLDRNRIIGAVQCRMVRSNNTRDFYNASHGYDNLAAGEANTNSITWSKSNPDLMAWMCFDFGPFVSRNRGDSWDQPNIVNPGTSDSKGGGSIAIHPTDPDKWICIRGSYIQPQTVLISTDGGRSTRNSFRPSFFGGNSGIGIKQHWADWHTDGSDTCYAQSGISFNAGNSWTTWESRDSSGVFTEAFGGTRQASGVHGRSPVDGNILYAFDNACQRILRTTDLGRSWQQISNEGPGASRNQPYSFAPDALDRNVAWWWVRGSGLKRYDASTGQITTHATEWKSLDIGRVRVSPLNGNHIYLLSSMGSNGVPFVIRSTTGENGPWIDVSGNLPRVGANRSMEIEPTTGIVFVVGTAGTRILPPPGGHPDFVRWLKRFGY